MRVSQLVMQKSLINNKKYSGMPKSECLKLGKGQNRDTLYIPTVRISDVHLQLKSKLFLVQKARSFWILG